MLHLINQAQDQGERVGQFIAYAGGSALAVASNVAQDLPASPWVINLALICASCVVVGRLLLDVVKWWDRRDSSDKDKRQ